MNAALLSTVMLLFMGWTGAQPPGRCGESFCLPPDALLVSKETPVDDFNLYQVRWRGAEFRIYEGNFPQGLRDTSRTTVLLPTDPAARLRAIGGHGSIIVATRKGEWPAYLDVMGPCRSTKECVLRSFAGEIHLRK